MLQALSQITFLNYKNLQKAADLFEGVLGFERVLDSGWVCVWRSTDKAFVGAVEKEEDSSEGVLLSFTVDRIEEVYEEVSRSKVTELTKIEKVGELPMRSFFFKDEEGHSFEIQQFESEEWKALFE